MTHKRYNSPQNLSFFLIPHVLCDYAKTPWCPVTYTPVCHCVQLFLQSIESQNILSWKESTGVIKYNPWLHTVHPKSKPSVLEHCPNAPWTPALGAMPTALGSLFCTHQPLVKSLFLTCNPSTTREPESACWHSRRIFLVQLIQKLTQPVKHCFASCASAHISTAF